jgi:SAM-dependent methyltransferase
VLGFDLSPSAVATAREVSGYADVLAAIAEHGGAVEFTEASAVDLGGAERVQARARELGGFAVVLDSALLHCLDDEAQRAYLAGVRPLVRPGGKLLLGCFSDANPEPWSCPGEEPHRQVALAIPRARRPGIAACTAPHAATL